LVHAVDELRFIFMELHSCRTFPFPRLRKSVFRKMDFKFSDMKNPSTTWQTAKKFKPMDSGGKMK
jgi:hypothetical protein